MPRARLVLPLLLLALTLLAYSNSFSGTFEGDSSPLVTADPRVAKVTAHNLALIFTQHYWYPIVDSALYRPLVTLSWMFNYAVLGNGPHAAGYHAVNLAFHLANVLLAFLLALRVFRSHFPAFFTAAIFAIHPVNVESVTNIAGRADLMAALGVLAALLLHSRANRGAFTVAGIFAAALFGLFSKESAIILPAAMLLYDVVFRSRREIPKLIPAYAAVVIAVIAMLGTRAWLLARLPIPDVPFLDNPLTGAAFWTARATALEIIWRYIALLLWPRWLSWDYSYHQVPLATFTGGLAAFAAILILLAILAALYRRRPPIAFYGLFFFLALVPTANLFLLIGSIMAERFLYLPSIGFAACLVALASLAARHKLAAPAFLTLAVAALGARTYFRNADWTNGERLWESGVEVCPDSFKTHQGMVSYLSNHGLNLGNIDRAIAEAQKSVDIVRGLPPLEQTAVPLTALATLYLNKGEILSAARPAESASWYRQALATFHQALVPDRAYNQMRRRRELDHGRPADRIHTYGHGYLYYYLAETYRRLGMFPEAIVALEYRLKLTPLDPGLYSEIADLERVTGNRPAYVMWLWEAQAMGDSSAELQLIAAYADRDPAGCAVANSRLNRDCPAVRADLCRAVAHLDATLRDAGHPGETPSVSACPTALPR